MIHQWLNTKRNTPAHDPGRNASSRRNREFGSFEQLEEKRCLAFLGFFDGVTLDVVQTAEDGDIVVENTTGVSRTTDNAGTFTFVNSLNVTVDLIDNTANRLDFLIDTLQSGDVELSLGDGVRDVFFLGTSNQIGGDLTITGGTGTQELNVEGVSIRGSAGIDLGLGVDYVITNGQMTVDGDLSLTGVNEFEFTLMAGLPGPPVTGGNVTIDVSGEDVQSSLIPVGGGAILGNFTYLGNDNIDRVDLGGTSVMGDVNIDLGIGNPFFGDPQLVEIGGTVQGDVMINAGDAILGNEINLLGSFAGNIVSITGSDTVDTVIYSFNGTQADVFAVMGGGDDVFELNVPVNLLEIDFGNDLGDMFVNNVAPIDFNFEFDITNFQFFDHFYTALDDTLVMNQIADTGNIIIDNDGGMSGFDWQLFTAIGGTSSTVQAENLILTMLPNTGNNVEMDLFNPVLASITMSLGDGSRNVAFTGIANNPLRDIMINAGAGDQNVDLSVNNPLGVATLAIDLGTGFDTVDDNANNLTINEDLILTGVNHFENDGVLLVTRNAFIDTSGENENSLFANNGMMFVGNRFSYIGGDGSDELRLNGAGGTTITREALIDLGDSTAGGDQFVYLNDANTSFGRSLTIISTNSLGDDVLLTDMGTGFGGNLDIDLGDGTNKATIVGVFGGTTVHYTGGAGEDTVVYGLTGMPVILTVDLGAGDDSFELRAGSSIASPLTIDFGPGADTFVNNYGAFDFDAFLYGLYGFDHVYQFVSGTLTSTQVEDFGSTITVDNNGPLQAIRFIDGGTTVLGPVTSLTVNMLNHSVGDLNVDLDNALAGNLTLNLGDGARALNLTGNNNSIGGDLTVTAGSDAQTVEVAVNNALSVGGNASFSLGTGIDVVDEDSNDINIVGNLGFSGVNFFENDGTMTVGGNVNVDNSGEAEASFFDDDATMAIAGNFTYLGGSDNDQVTLNGLVATTIGGDAFIDLGDNTSGFVQLAWLNQPATSVGGNLTVLSSGASAADEVLLVAAASYGGNINIDLGDGANTANIVGTFGGTDVTYNGGSGVDNVMFGTTGSPADVLVNLGAGDDTFTLLAGASIQPTTLTVDFGGGNDTFVNNYGPFDFDANLLNLNGFSHIYNLAGMSLTSTQVSASGPVTIDNNGTAGAIRFIDGGTTELTPVTHLIVNLLNGPGTDLDVDLDNALTGDLTLNLGDGARALNLTGSNNSIGGNLTVTAGTDAQTVEVAVNNNLTVGGNASFDLGTGNDTVDEDTNDITITGNLEFTGVNQFENGGMMTVGGNVSVDNSGETESSQFNDDTTLSISGNFTYLGGNGDDAVLLTGAGGTDIGGTVYVDLGDNVLGGTQTVSFNAPGGSVGGTLTVISTSTTNPDTFVAFPTTSFGGDISVDLGGGQNDAIFAGVFGGSDVTYTGGSGMDNVTYFMSGNPANLMVNLGLGDDLFSLFGGLTQLTALNVDFGGGNDTFVNNYGMFDFDANLLNLNGFSHMYNLAGMSLTSTQVSASGPVTINNSGAAGAIQFIDGGITELTPVDHLTVNLLDGSGTNLNLALDNAFAGDLTLDLGNGTRAVNFDGLTNSLGGHLTVTGGSGTQTVRLSVNNGLTVGGDALIDLGQGADVVDEDGNDVTITGNLGLTGVNVFDNDGNMSVGGGLTIDNSVEVGSSTFRNDASLNVSGNFMYTGNLASDDVLLTAGTVIGGDINIKGGGGTNTILLRGILNGTAVKYNGGSGMDNVTYGLTGTPVDPNIKLSTGNDLFMLDAGSAINSSLRVDFGTGVDMLENNFGAFAFDAKLLNLNGFDRFYDLATGSLNMQQDLDTGAVTLDNNGVGNAIRLINGGVVTAMTPASNVRLIFLDNTASQVTVDLDSAFAGDMILQLRSGARDVMFTGSSNTVGGLLRIEAADGVQNVHLAVNADLNVGGNLVINGRDGSDTIDEGANNVSVAGTMILRGVNEFRNDHTLTVGGDFNMVTTLESTDTQLVNNGTVDIAGNLTYLGGGGVDEFLFNSGTATIGGYSYISLDQASDLVNTQRVRLIGNYSTSQLFVVGGNSTAGNVVVTDASTSVAGDVTLNFQTTTTANSVLLSGNFGGTFGSYLGGTGVDNLTLGIDASSMFFVGVMNDGDDSFVLESSTVLAELLVDFGAGNDTLIDNLGQPYPFPVTFANL